MKTHPTAQTFGCFDVELRGQWLEAKGAGRSSLLSTLACPASQMNPFKCTLNFNDLLF